MASEWEHFSLAEIGQIITGKTPSTSQAKNFGGDIPFITPSDMDARKTISHTERNLTEAGAKSVSSSIIPAGSVIVSCIGSDMGKAAIAGRRCVTNQQINSVVVDAKRFDSEFIYYNLSRRKSEIRSYASGSAQPILNKSGFSEIVVSCPSIEVQHEIVGILCALDDKIELNRRMNATLEAMAQALFKSWFVDFDPVKAKAAGRAPEGMDADTAAFFPGEFVESELGLIPKGWGVGTIDEATALIIDHRGKTPKKLGNDWALSGIPAISAKNIKAGRMVQKDSMNFVDHELFDRWMKDKLKVGDILLTSEAPLGELLYLARNSELCLSQRVFALRANQEKCQPGYLYLWLGSAEAQDRLNARATGTTVVGIRQSELRKVEVLLPPKDIQEKANLFFHDCLVKINVNEEENESLAAIRDALLPKLISGQLRIPKAEVMAEAGL